MDRRVDEAASLRAEGRVVDFSKDAMTVRVGFTRDASAFCLGRKAAVVTGVGGVDFIMVSSHLGTGSISPTFTSHKCRSPRPQDVPVRGCVVLLL